jgi:hypothetical protein
MTFALCFVSWHTTLPPTLPDPPMTSIFFEERFSSDIVDVASDRLLLAPSDDANDDANAIDEEED